MDSHTNGNMNTSSKPSAPTETQEVAQGWTYERRLAFFLLGKLALDGFLTDNVFAELDYVIDSTAQQISEGIEALCSDGDLEAVSAQADIGRMYMDKEGQS